MNQIDLSNRVAVVTGGARGIGYGVAQRFLQSGADVALWDQDAERLATAREALQQDFPVRRVEALALDLTDTARVDEGMAGVAARLGRIDILVNNAGITGGNGPTWELDPTVWRRVVEVNLVAPFLTCRAAVPYMLKGGWGRIVNVASIAGKEGNPNASHYSASKAGLIGLSKSLGKELATRNILVNAITPAAARTEIFDQMKQEHIDYMLSKIPMGRFLAVDEVAAMVAWLSSDDCAFTTASVFDISGGRATY
ncbi:MAG: SDR family NAD(P)-dependent oxidoreductase [Rhodoferax sp.]|nr:SDR family NAD(P)-dependent oxidoreductase [Rhodoferax sp.]